MPKFNWSWLKSRVSHIENPPPGGPPPEEPAAIANAPRWSLRKWDGDVPRDAAVAQLDISGARALLQDAIAEYLALQAPEHGLLIRAAPGLGKTTLGVWAAEQWILDLLGKHVLYAGPRHDFFLDLMAIAKRPNDWYEWQPRQLEDRDKHKPETCPYAPQINTWLARGHQAIDFCSQICSWDYVSNDCVWHAQKRRTEPIVFGMHQHVTMGHPMEFDLCIGDESPIGSFAHDWRIPARYVVPSGMPPAEPFTHLLALLLTVVMDAEKKRPVQGAELLERLGGAEDVVASTAQYVEAWQPTPHIRRAEEAENVSYRHAQPVAALLYREAKAATEGRECVPRISCWKEKLHLCLRRPLYDKLPSHLIWLDATANERLYQRCFKRPFKTLSPQPQMAGRFYQVWDRSNSKGSMVDASDAKALQAKPRVAQASRLIEKVATDRNYQAIAIVTHKGVIEVSLELREIDHGHYFAARGTNQLQDHDALFVVGTPMPSSDDLVHLASAVFFERDEPFRPVWYTADRPYNWRDETGQAWAWPTLGFWSDPDLLAVLTMSREDEVVQAAHRVRPLHREADVWLLTNIPTSLPLDGLFSMRELMDAPKGVNVFKWDEVYQTACRIDEERGVVTAYDLAEVCSVCVDTAKSYVKRLQDEYGWERVAAARRGARGPAPHGLHNPKT